MTVRPLRLSIAPALGAAIVAIVISGCGSAKTTTTTTKTSTAAKPGTKTATTTSTTPANVIPPGSVAIAAGTPITQSAFSHWLDVAVKSQASQSPGQPAIVPDPPAFTNCIAEAKKLLPRSSTTKLRADCSQLFRSLSSQVMDFLITSSWFAAEANRLHVAPTAAQVDRAYKSARTKQFPTESSYQSFLAKTGQTDQDVLFRFRINVIYSKLQAKQKGSQKARQAAIERQVKQTFLAGTRCAPLYLMSDCANYGQGGA